MSYPLYLNHWIGVFAANALLTPFGMRGSDAGHVLSSSLNIAIAVALYWYIDRRLLQQRSGWYTRQRGLFVTRTAYLMVGLGLSVGGALLLQRLA
jgi:peptidoglycan/LPS O-acetylase OafA/YrhL